MLTISVDAARAQVAVLSKSTDANVRQYAKALSSEADAATAAGKSDFDLAQPASANYQAALDALNAALASG